MLPGNDGGKRLAKIIPFYAPFGKRLKPNTLMLEKK
jgi:hypothetical protein